MSPAQCCCWLLLSLLVGTQPPSRSEHQDNAAAKPQIQGAVEQHLRNGDQALKEKRYARAEKEFRAVLAIEPGLAMRARFPLAVALFEQHNWGEARREFEAVRSAEGDQPRILYYLGRLDLEQPNYKAAVEKLGEASERPPFPDTAYYLGLAYLKLGSEQDAERWFAKAVDVNPTDARAEHALARLYRRQGRENEARQVSEHSKEMKVKLDKPSQLKWECGQELDRGPGPPAPSCERLDDPNNADLLTALGILYGQHGQLEKSLKPLQRAAELSPQSPQMQYNLAHTYYELSRFADTRATLEPAVRRWPDLFPLNSLYGAALFKLNDMPSAYEALRHARELNVQDSTNTKLLYECTLELATQVEGPSAVEAFRYLQEAVQLAPGEPEPHRRLAVLYRRIGDLEKAHEEEQKAGAQP